MAAALEAAAIDNMLLYVGFAVAANRVSIAADGLESFDAILSLTETDVSSLSKGFADRRMADGRITFGLRRTNLLKAVIHWAQDFRRISREVTLDGIADADEFKAAIEIAAQRAKIRKHNADESDAVSKAADPGKLKRQKEWTAWSRGLKNYLSTILGQNGVPLSYIIRENEQPDYALEAENDYDFEELSVNCAPMTGLVFKTDARKVHQLIHGFVQGETSETWIKASERRNNGRLDYLALLAHYGGEGNKAVRIKEAENLRKTLIYKNERVMSFEKFLTSMEYMFTGFHDNGETQTDSQKIRLLFDKIQCTDLQQTKSALEVSEGLDIAGNSVTYNFIANQLSAKAATLPDYVARNASGVGREDLGPAPESGVKGPDGKVHTGYFSNWHDLSEADQRTVTDERKRLGQSSTKKKTGRRASALKAKKKKLNVLTRKVAAMNVKFKNLKKRSAASDDDEDDEEGPQDNAGDQFGGRKGKGKAKSNKK